ncbi:MAG: glycosyltransferase family 2 protein [Candidatus Omnitrophica bacterium]|nr:glycosyltransferase family 2 protein [Candidatus Omnitrophota bacterium]
MQKIEIVIPAYNEEENIGQLLQDIYATLGKDLRILVIDDASSDKTAEIARQYGAEVIQHPYRIGNGACIKTGLRNTASEIIVLMDADGQHRPQDIPRLLKQIDNFDMVVGQRDFSGFTLRNLANIIYNVFASYVTQFKIKDLTCGFRAVKRMIALKFLYLLPNGFSYPATLTLAFLRSGRTIKYVPISNAPRLKGKSKIRLFQDGARFFIIITKIATLFSPLRVFIPISLFFFLSGLTYYLYTYITQHRFTNMAVFLLTTAILIFMLGLISEQINQLRMEKTEEDI